MNRKATQTLYELVKEWTVQPWDGIIYSRSVETLWDSIEAYGLVEGLFGMTVTLLESCVIDSVEKIDSGQIDMDQAVENLIALLDIDDFARGAKTIEVYTSTNPVCRISNIDRLLEENRPRGPLKPQWWKRSVRSYWLSVGAISFVTMIIFFSILIGLGVLPPIQLVLSIVGGIAAYAMSYYFRTVATKRMWRAVFIMLGAGGIGFWCLALPIALLFGPTIRLLPFWLGLPLLYILPVIGGFIGDWFGKKRDYRPYM
jgi:hypothetical protein